MPPKDKLPPEGPGWCWKVECGYVFVTDRVAWTICVRAGDWTAAESYVEKRGTKHWEARCAKEKEPNKKEAWKAWQ